MSTDKRTGSVKFLVLETHASAEACKNVTVPAAAKAGGHLWKPDPV